MSSPLILFFAMLLDATLGEPDWLWSRIPHPAVLMGRAVGWLDRLLNTGRARHLRGGLALLALALSALLAGFAIQTLGWAAELIVAAILLAQRSLVDHVSAVADALRLSVGDARLTVARIVGRDTATMDPPAIARAAIESAAENLSDGVIAPAFWFLLGGLPGLLLYKVTNTADSMIGHRTPRHGQFGWAAARFDDLLNLVPSRLTALILSLCYHLLPRWREIAADARRHRSPNAGWPEAAAARALDIALSGPRAYHGTTQNLPYIHETGRKDIGPPEIDAACRLLWRSWGCLLGLALLVSLITG